MRGLVGDSSITSRVRPGTMAPRTALQSEGAKTWGGRAGGHERQVNSSRLSSPLLTRTPGQQAAAAVLAVTGQNGQSTPAGLQADQAAPPFHSLQVTGVDIRHVNASIRHHPRQQAARAAVQVIAWRAARAQRQAQYVQSVRRGRLGMRSLQLLKMHGRRVQRRTSAKR